MLMLALLLAAGLISYVHVAWLDGSSTEQICVMLILTALLTPAAQEIAPGIAGFIISILTAGLMALSGKR
mgnify:CR=1 FL=1